jgi:putative RNA 2'-phosphotransferase
MRDDLVHASRFLSFVLRHRPDAIGLTLDAEGWADVRSLLAAAATHGEPLTLELIRQVVAENDKKRFSLSPDESRIRAVQGHSVPVDLQLQPVQPPARLYHGTATRFLPSIREHGLRSGSRQYVHLSISEDAAVEVGRRHGKPVVLTIDAGRMGGAGYRFRVAENGVWLTDAVPVEFILFP